MNNNIATVVKHSLQLANKHNYNMLTQCMGNYHGECSATCRDHMMLHSVNIVSLEHGVTSVLLKLTNFVQTRGW